MSISRSFSLKAVVGAALVLLLGLVGTAEARKFAMSGKWVQRRGVVYIPVGPASGGIPAVSGAQVSVQPGGTLTVPPNQFHVSTGVVWPMPQPTVVQMSTNFIENAPKSTGVLKAGHWTATRAFKDFAWCPGATANPNCATPKSTGQGAPPGQGTNQGLIRYKAGPLAFGGTMQMVSGGGGTISFLIGVTGPTVMHNPFGGATGAAPTEAPGGPYANSTLDDVFPAGPITAGAQFSPYGLITVPGTIVGYGTTATWDLFGFPWTTGQVYIATGPYMSNTLATLTGSHALTPGGAGNITLVAGGLGNGLHADITYILLDYVQLQLTSLPSPVPSMSPAGVAAGVALLVLAGGYALRRRF